MILTLFSLNSLNFSNDFCNAHVLKHTLSNRILHLSAAPPRRPRRPRCIRQRMLTHISHHPRRVHGGGTAAAFCAPFQSASLITAPPLPASPNSQRRRAREAREVERVVQRREQRVAEQVDGRRLGRHERVWARRRDALERLVRAREVVLCCCGVVVLEWLRVGEWRVGDGGGCRSKQRARGRAHGLSALARPPHRGAAPASPA